MPRLRELTPQELYDQCRHKKIGVVAMENGMSPQQLVGILRETGLMGNRPADPTPSEIAALAAEIRRTRWDEATRQARWVGARTAKIT